MQLAAGTRLGPYEVVSALGAGGMGEVYRARDTKLGRDVAIKVLPETVASDPERLARFHREAQVLASLNHPNIAAIYGLEGQLGQVGTLALVMELVEGPTLADMLAGQPSDGKGHALPVGEALAIARQIAAALEAAHEQGIVHRDLKPANIKVREDGAVKVLDFGLAKLADTSGSGLPASGSSLLSVSPTIASPVMTGVAVLLGTAAYMSPEQARGKAVDKRADIWAFGCVLYEMVTGERLFQGEDLTETLAAVVKEPLDVTRVPPQLHRLLRKCLEKDPKKRLRDIGDAWELIEDPRPEVATVAVARPSSRASIGWTVAGIVTIAIGAVSLLYVRRAPAASSRRMHVSVPLADVGAAPGFFALSPDGRSVVMIKVNNEQAARLAVRSLESGELRSPLAGTDSARAPFWSPDSRTIGFFVGNQLKTVPASGGTPQALCDGLDGAAGGGATWNRAGTILFSAGQRLMTVSTSGGACTEIIKADVGLTRTHPAFLPDGEHFLYQQVSNDDAQTGVYVASLKDPAGRRLLAERSTALFAADAPGSTLGHILFVREQTLMAQAFDARSLQLSGEPAALAGHVSVMNNTEIAASVADDGTVLYLANARTDRQMVWYDRTGKELGREANTGFTSAAISISTDGKRMSFRRADDQGRLSWWLRDVGRSQEVRFTNPPMALGAGSAVWSPDGRRIAFAGGRDGQETGIWIKDVNGGTGQLAMHGGSNQLAVSDWSRDGRWLAYSDSDAKTGTDIWLLPIGGEPGAAKPIPLLHTAALESQAQFSPDGKWIAYSSDELGARHVFVRSFNAGSLGDEKWQASFGAVDMEPRWRADSKELFYTEAPALGRRRLVSVPIGTPPNLLGTPRPLFEVQTVSTVPQANVFLYVPSADGQRFLVSVFASDVNPTFEMLLGWWSGK